MAVESAPYVADLNPANPLASDFVYEGDDHMRLIKAAIKATFPNLNAAVTATPAQLNTAGIVTPGVWTLQKEVTISGSPSAIDFIHGTGGVVLDSTSDEYQITYEDVWPNSGGSGEMELFLSINAGSTWTFLSNPTYGQSVKANGTTLTAALFSGMNKVKLFGGNTGSRVSGAVEFRNRPNVSSGVIVGSLYMVKKGEDFITGAFAAGHSSTAAINGIRLACSAGNFGAYGRVRLFSRKTA